jgi:hypothetical protein
MKNSKVFGAVLFLILLHTLAFADNKPEQAEAKKEAQNVTLPRRRF